ncbi:hypothetical protein CCR75_003689 [Bremia lactucae]|uniref:Temptin Cys/Cys disulfide domain-containing protein n=1 Tax=Bremia lactucae TaxID=4779 RepID=A0A976NYK9_BRELC|nr:hypothetical protein CCR75_003689 [Bremia lactucae]
MSQMAVFVAAFMQTVTSHSSYSELIPNGENILKPLGHTETAYTGFGQLFSDEGTDWSNVCNMTWPGGSVTCGEALGDPCCRWKNGVPDYTLTEPSLDGTICATSSDASSGDSSAATYGPDTTESTVATKESPIQTDITFSSDAVTDSSEYCG